MARIRRPSVLIRQRQPSSQIQQFFLQNLIFFCPALFLSLTGTNLPSETGILILELLNLPLLVLEVDTGFVGFLAQLVVLGLGSACTKLCLASLVVQYGYVLFEAAKVMFPVCR
jgi:hypothetical protein